MFLHKLSAWLDEISSMSRLCLKWGILIASALLVVSMAISLQLGRLPHYSNADAVARGCIDASLAALFIALTAAFLCDFLLGRQRDR